jgi:hypothetical protein
VRVINGRLKCTKGVLPLGTQLGALLRRRPLSSGHSHGRKEAAALRLRQKFSFEAMRLDKQKTLLEVHTAHQPLSR